MNARRRTGDGDCIRTLNGVDYVGHRMSTVNGLLCQAWASQSPHAHNHNQDSMFPDGSVDDARNYCRNPNDWNGGLWCMTMDDDTVWEACDVPFCGQSLRCIAEITRGIFSPCSIFVANVTRMSLTFLFKVWFDD